MSVSIDPISDHDALLAEGEVHVWHADLTQVSTNAADALSLLDQDERARSARLRGDVDRTQFVTAHGMARILLGLYLGCPPRAVRFGYARHGKPYVICADRQVGLRFNASRTKDLAIFAVSAEREVGIDIERLNLDHASVDAVTQALTERERAVLNPLPSKIERYAGCLNAWARKEAYLKARGVGLMISPADVDTEPKSGRIYLYGKWQQRWRVYDLAVGDCYSAAVAAEGEHWRIVLREFKMLKIVHPALANPVIG